jgi:polyisoprenoid-binding protein YceI
MRKSKIFTLSLMLSFVTGHFSSAQSQTNFSITVVKASVNGTSTLHDWESEITQIDCKGSLQSKGKTPQAIKEVEVKIPVESIKSKEGKIMDHKTYEAFKSDQNPFIIYTFKSAQVRIDPRQAVTIDISGNLTMAGTSRQVSLTAKGKKLPNGNFQLSVSQKLKMTDFGMKPPTAVLGTITVGDEVTVNFDLTLVPANNNN